MENFSLEKINNMPINEAIEYLTKYFVPLSDGRHAMLQNGKYTIYEDELVKRVWFNRMNSLLNEYYFRHFTGVKLLEELVYPEPEKQIIKHQEHVDPVKPNLLNAINMIKNLDSHFKTKAKKQSVVKHQEHADQYIEYIKQQSMKTNKSYFF